MASAYSDPMTCDELRQAVARGRAATDAVRAHAEACDTCGELLAGGPALARLLSEPATDPEAPLAALTRLRAELARERGLVASLRAAPTPARGLLAITVALAMLGAVATVTRRPDLGIYPAERMAVALLGLGALLAGAIGLALRPPHARALPDGRYRLWAAVSVSVCVGLSLMPAAHVAHPASIAGAGADLIPRALACFLFGMATGAPVLLILRALDRWESGALWPTVLGAVGLGLAGNLALQLHCPITHPVHLLLGHATVAVVSLGLGFVLWRTFGRRAS